MPGPQLRQRLEPFPPDAVAHERTRAEAKIDDIDAVRAGQRPVVLDL
jgi:hypothetical protein